MTDIVDDYSADTSTTGRLAVGASTSGRFERAGDRDWLKFHAEPGAVYTFLAYPPSLADPSLGLVSPTSARIVDAAGNVVQADGWRFEPAIGGDYYFDVLGLQAGNYRINLSSRSDDIGSSNGTLATLAPRGSVAAKIDYEADIDRIKVSLEAERYYSFTLQTEDMRWDGLLYLQLRNASGELMPAGANMTVGPLPAGDYYLDVIRQPIKIAQTAPIAYTVSMGAGLRDDVGNTVASSQVLAPDARTGGALQSTLDVDMFKVEMQAGISYAFALNPADGRANNLDLRIVGADGVLLERFYHGDAGAATYASFTPAASGDFFIAIDSHYAEQYNTAYTLALTRPRLAIETGGNNLLAGGAGIALDGGAGIDTVRYAGLASAYQVRREGASVIVSGEAIATDTLHNIERLVFDQQAPAIALDVDGNGGQAYRLYQAALDRQPDLAGLGFWIARLDQGASLRDIASGFAGSAEFKSLYGASPSHADYVNQLYQNVLHRAGESAGMAYWVDALEHGAARAEVLMEFSESAENKAALVGVMENGFAYTSYFG